MDEKDDIVKLEWDEIETEVNKLREWLKDIPDELKSDTAIRLIRAIATSCSENFFEALGLCEEAKLHFRETYLEIMVAEHLRENAEDYRCIEALITTNNKRFVEGRIYQATFEPEIESYYLYADDENRTHCKLRKECFERRFERN